MALPTNYKDDVLGDSMGGKRRYRMIENSDGTVSFDDVTEYTQFGSNFGAKQINETNEAVNKSVKNADIIDTENGIKENTKSGKVAGALAVKEIAESKQDKIEKSLQTSDGKAGMRSDNEGGNFFLKSKNGKHWEADAYNDNLRVYYEDGAIAFTFSNDGSMNIADLVISSVTTRMSEFIRKIKNAAYCTVVNNATTTGAGTVLDGRMGKTLNDSINNAKNRIGKLEGYRSWKKIGYNTSGNVSIKDVDASEFLVFVKFSATKDTEGIITINIPAIAPTGYYFDGYDYAGKYTCSACVHYTQGLTIKLLQSWCATTAPTGEGFTQNWRFEVYAR